MRRWPFTPAKKSSASARPWDAHRAHRQLHLCQHRGDEALGGGQKLRPTSTRATAIPTLTIAEEKIAALEGAEAAVVAASGSAAISSALLSLLRAGDELIATRQLYGGSYQLLRDIFPRFGIVVRLRRFRSGGIERLVNPRTKALYVETPTNPTLRLVDLRARRRFRPGMGS